MAKFKYCIDGSELVVKDLPAFADTYNDGEILKAGALANADDTGTGLDGEVGAVSSMNQTGGGGDSLRFVGVSNQGETLPAQSGLSSAGNTLGNDGATLTGTHALATLDTLKVIINPGAIYAIEYSQATPITWTASTDTTLVYTCTSGEGTDDAGGSWAYSTDTGQFDYVITSATAATDSTLTILTGGDTTAAAGIIIQQAGTGSQVTVPLTADALDIEAGEIDIDTLVAGTDAITLTILENRVESVFNGSEILRPQKTPGSGGLQDKSVRSNGAPDRAKIFAYAKINGNVWQA